MDSREAGRTLEVIRTLMERTCQYQFLTARAGLAAGLLAGVGALLFALLDPRDPWYFGTVWGLVFAGSLLMTVVGSVMRVRELGEQLWSRQAKAVVQALLPALFSALVLSVLFFSMGLHLWLPGVWMLCYGQGALATAVYAPRQIKHMGYLVLLTGAATLTLGPDWAVVMMGVVFGLGHVGLGLVLIVAERRAGRGLRLFRTVA
jgi:hypothetical protein